MDEISEMLYEVVLCPCAEIVMFMIVPAVHIGDVSCISRFRLAYKHGLPSFHSCFSSFIADISTALCL